MYGMFLEYIGQFFLACHTRVPDLVLQIGKAKTQAVHVAHAPWQQPYDDKLDLPRMPDNYEQRAGGQTDQLIIV